MANLIRSLSEGCKYNHPLLSTRGWWHRNNPETKASLPLLYQRSMKPLLIIGKTGTLGNAFARVCSDRSIAHYLLGREDVDITNIQQIEDVIEKYNPWAIINTAGFVRVDDAESAVKNCFDANTLGPQLLASACKKNQVQFLTFSSDLVFDGNKKSPYYEDDKPCPLNIYGKSKARAEEIVLKTYDEALIVRTSSFFSPWDKYNFIHHVVENLSANNDFMAACDVVISPTYLPDLVNACLDLLVDGESGIWHLTNNGEITWAELAITIAEKASLNPNKIICMNADLMNWIAPRPKYSVLKSINGNLLPSLNSALNRYLEDRLTIKKEIEV